MRIIRAEIAAVLEPLTGTALAADTIADRTMQRFWAHRVGDLDPARAIPPGALPTEDLQAPEGYAAEAMTVALSLGLMERALRRTSWVDIGWPTAYAAEAVAQALNARSRS